MSKFATSFFLTLSTTAFAQLPSPDMAIFCPGEFSSNKYLAMVYLEQNNEFTLEVVDLTRMGRELRAKVEVEKDREAFQSLPRLVPRQKATVKHANEEGTLFGIYRFVEFTAPDGTTFKVYSENKTGFLGNALVQRPRHASSLEFSVNGVALTRTPICATTDAAEEIIFKR